VRLFAFTHMPACGGGLIDQGTERISCHTSNKSMIQGPRVQQQVFAHALSHRNETRGPLEGETGRPCLDVKGNEF
jgi:hypothetical protein